MFCFYYTEFVENSAFKEGTVWNIWRKHFIKTEWSKQDQSHVGIWPDHMCMIRWILESNTVDRGCT